MRRPRILVVDDKENMRKLFLRILSDVYDVTLAVDGASAIHHLTTEVYDLVLTDIRMPGADGFEVLRFAKGKSPGTAVVLMTAFGDVANAVEAMRQGAYDYLTKPCDPDDVAFVLARALAASRQTRAMSEPTGEVVATVEDDLLSLPYSAAVEMARDRVSRAYLTALMTECNGNVTHAAERAGIERESLHRLLRRYGLRSEDFKR